MFVHSALALQLCEPSTHSFRSKQVTPFPVQPAREEPESSLVVLRCGAETGTGIQDPLTCQGKMTPVGSIFSEIKNYGWFPPLTSAGRRHQTLIVQGCSTHWPESPEREYPDCRRSRRSPRCRRPTLPCPAPPCPTPPLSTRIADAVERALGVDAVRVHVAVVASVGALEHVEAEAGAPAPAPTWGGKTRGT